jgi:hypothetical protein
MKPVMVTAFVMLVGAAGALAGVGCGSSSDNEGAICPGVSVSCPTVNQCCDPSTPYLCPSSGLCYATKLAADGDSNCGGWIPCGGAPY